MLHSPKVQIMSILEEKMKFPADNPFILMYSKYEHMK